MQTTRCTPSRTSAALLSAFLIAVLTALCTAPLAAQTDSSDTEALEAELFGESSTESTGGSGTTGEEEPVDEEALFGGNEEGEAEEGDAMISQGDSGQQDHEQELLTSEEVIIGGRFVSSAAAMLHWGAGNWPDPARPLENLSNTALIGIRSSLYFDARPQENFRVFGKVKTSYPFYRENPSGQKIPDITIFELYADTNWNNRLFIRAGKQVAMWGVGHFYSPADFLSLSMIDPEDPEAEREGPAAVKLTVPLGIHSLYLHLLAPPAQLDALASGGGDLGDSDPVAKRDGPRRDEDHCHLVREELHGVPGGVHEPYRCHIVSLAN